MSIDLIPWLPVLPVREKAIMRRRSSQQTGNFAGCFVETKSYGGLRMRLARHCWDARPTFPEKIPEWRVASFRKNRLTWGLFNL
jgi:hypothetical protein